MQSLSRKKKKKPSPKFQSGNVRTENPRKRRPQPNSRRRKVDGRKRVDVSKYINKNLETKVQKEYILQHTFEDFDLSKKLLKQISNIGYSKPTEIQDKAIPHILEGKDVIGIAGTGTGKTAAFLIPSIQRIIQQPEDQSVLVITPTRELATQISDEFKKITRGLKLYTTSLIGGTKVDRSIRDLRRTNHIIIATPGRLIDMVNRSYLSLDNFRTLILDEFDRMLDMGFLSDIMEIIQKMSYREQTLLFSATLEDSQKSIVKSITNNPEEIKAGVGTQLTTAIEQDVVYVPKGRKKVDVLIDLLNEDKEQKAILFCETKRQVDQVCKNLQRADIQVDMIHGDKTQKARELALRKFKQGKVRVLVATDVLARGIDVIDVSLVINYEIPRNYNDYIHRIGRTGRAGRTGKAYTLID